MPPSFEQICREIGWIHPAFTLWSGDNIEGYGDTPDEANQEYDVFLASAKLTGVPMFNVPGNHEFSSDTALLPIYEKRMGALYGSFDYGNSHFIGLNTNAIGPDGKITDGSLDDTQWTWLENDLKVNHNSSNIFVFLHHYVFGPAVDTKLDTGWVSLEARDRFHAMMVKYGVRAVFAGHNHIYWHENKDGVDYYISGGAGAPMDASPEKGGFLHYVLVTVEDKTVSTSILQPWHLSVDYPESNEKSPNMQKALVTNTNNQSVTAKHITFYIPTPKPQKELTVSASIAYKDKSTLANAKILSIVPINHGREVEVTVEAKLKAARTTEITVQTIDR